MSRAFEFFVAILRALLASFRRPEKPAPLPPPAPALEPHPAAEVPPVELPAVEVLLPQPPEVPAPRWSEPPRGDVWPSVRQSFRAFSASKEGVCSWMYVDIKGLVTTAVGGLLRTPEDALRLPWIWKTDGRRATDAEVIAEWHHVSAQTAWRKAGAGAAEKGTNLRLSPEVRERFFWQTFDADVRALCLRFQRFPAWPAPAQKATLSLVWAVGSSMPKHVKFKAALDREDFATAAAEVAIKEETVEAQRGVDARNTANKQLLLEAAETVRLGRDPAAILTRV